METIRDNVTVNRISLLALLLLIAVSTIKLTKPTAAHVPPTTTAGQEADGTSYGGGHWETPTQCCACTTTAPCSGEGPTTTIPEPEPEGWHLPEFGPIPMPGENWRPPTSR